MTSTPKDPKPTTKAKSEQGSESQLAKPHGDCQHDQPQGVQPYGSGPPTHFRFGTYGLISN